MNFQINGGGMGVFVVLSFLVGIASAIYWMVVGWRAMRAHEEIANCCEGWLRIRREERIMALRKAEGTATTPLPLDSGEDKFTPLKDAPPEYPWSTEV